MVTPNYLSPLQGFENADPLPTELNPDGKSLFNTPGTTKSPTYDQFPSPIDSSNNGFDFHSQLFQPRSIHLVTFFQFITCLQTRSRPITREHYTNGSGESFQRCAICFGRPHNHAEHMIQLRIYRFWDKAVGGSPTVSRNKLIR
jgi:hypothetical protein